MSLQFELEPVASCKKENMPSFAQRLHGQKGGMDGGREGGEGRQNTCVRVNDWAGMSSNGVERARSDTSPAGQVALIAMPITVNCCQEVPCPPLLA